MPNERKRAFLRKLRKFEKTRRAEISVVMAVHFRGDDEAFQEAVPCRVARMAAAWGNLYKARRAWLHDKLVGGDDRDGSLYPEPWLAVIRTLARDKRHNTRLLGFHSANEARRITKEKFPGAEITIVGPDGNVYSWTPPERKTEVPKEADKAVEDVIRFMPVYLAEHIARGNLERSWG